MFSCLYLQESSLAGLYEEMGERKSQLETHAKKLVDEISTNYAVFTTYSKKANSVIQSLKVSS